MNKTYDEADVRALLARNESAYREHIASATGRVPVQPAHIDAVYELTMYRVTRSLRQPEDVAPEPVVYRKAPLQ